jgi:2-methylisocitrate lyase-like PEP mutase family enzyme
VVPELEGDTSVTPGTARLRSLLERSDTLLLPGAYDGLSARILQQAGFEALYMSGSALTAAHHGAPDVGLLTQTEMVEQARRIVLATNGMPLICDADTGYGNVINVRRTVQLYEAAGVAAIHLEDQVTPKRCGHFDGKEVVAEADMVAKLRAALKSRCSRDFLIIARTDARAVLGFDAALDRARTYAAEGADMVFFEAPQSREELKRVAETIEVPLIVNVVEGGKTPQLPFAEFREMGYKVVLYPTASIRTVMKSLQNYANHLYHAKDTIEYGEFMIGFAERNELTNLSAYQEFEAEVTSGLETAS